ncbi:MAG: MFS transporter [Pseudomonadota bacterium]
MTDFAQRRAAAHRLVVVVLLGFASGLPLALTGQAMQAWLSVSGVNVATIGFLSLVGLPYTFKFLWAPLMDRFDLPWLGRRRGWLVVTQLAVALALWWMGGTSPSEATRSFALLALLVAFVSASQDVVIDAYRTDLLPASERGAGASLNVLGYRLAMILSGGVAFIWVDPVQGGGWTWPEVYRFMAGLMVGAAVLSAVVLPRLPAAPRPTSRARNDVQGFAAVLAVALLGFLLTAGLGEAASASVQQALCQQASWCWAADSGWGRLLRQGAFSPWAQALVVGGDGAVATPLQVKWAELLSLFMGLALTLPLAAWAARRARFETLLGGLGDYFRQPGAAAFLALIVLYKLGDAFAGSLMTPFLLQGVNFSVAEVGVVNKVIGLWLTIGGALLGGFLMMRLGLWRALLLFGVLQMLSNLGFWWLAVQGQGSMGAFTLPAFDWWFVKLAKATSVDGGLLMVIAAENLSGGMGTAAFVAFLMSLCHQRFTATQFALLSAFASIGRVWVGPLAGVVADSVGWPTFFILSTFAALPALAMLWWLRRPLRALEVDPKAPLVDD